MTKSRRKTIIKLKKKWASVLIKYNKKRAKKLRHKNITSQRKATQEINHIKIAELKLIGASLYWAEGYKKSNWNMVFSNSDEKMIRLMMAFFLKICHVDINKIKGQAQIHKNTTEATTNNYWSKVSGIPLTNFRKAQTFINKPNKSKRKINILPYGTFRIIINNVETVNLVKGWINGIAKQF